MKFPSESRPQGKVEASGGIPAQEEFLAPTRTLESVQRPEEFLDAVDLRALNEIFDQILNKSATDTKAPRRWVDKDSIHIEVSPDAEATQDNVHLGGSSNPKTEIIKIYWNQESVVSKTTLLRALSTLVHEMTHLRANHAFTLGGLDEPMRYNDGFREQIYDRRSESFKTESLALDEAVTEEIAVEVSIEYLRRTGNSGILESEEFKYIAKSGYTGDRIMLATVVNDLAECLGMDRQTLWRGFVRTYMEGNVRPRELKSEIGHELAQDDEVRNMLLPYELLKDQPHFDVNEVRQKISNPKLAMDAVKRVLNRMDERQVYDTLGLNS